MDETGERLRQVVRQTTLLKCGKARIALAEKRPTMDDKKVQKFRQRLTEEYQKLVRSINRNRLAEEEITLENTEDEGDLATISHNKELLYNLHESDFQRLKSIQEALKRMDRGEYGECLRCGEDINETRLMAVPWATLCIQCQEEAEKEGATSRPVMAGKPEDTDDD
jgi:DnaK suppressor protein